MYDYVRSILQDIKENGMTALLKYSQKFDGFSGPFPVSQKELVQISISPHDAEVIDAIVHRVKIIIAGRWSRVFFTHRMIQNTDYWLIP